MITINNQKHFRLTIKKFIKIYVLIFILLLFTSCAAESDKSQSNLIKIEYDVCSQQYDCNSVLGELYYPVRFELPDVHNNIEMTLVASDAYAFVDDASSATLQFPEVFGGYTNKGTAAFLDLVNQGINVIVSGYELSDTVYTDISGTMCATVAGMKVATYHTRFVDYEGNVIDSFNIPIGKTTINISPEIKYIDVYSMLELNDLEYKKSEITGKIAYENVHEIIEDDTVDPNISDRLPEKFIFWSGIGGWSNIMTIEKDGSFHGRYYDYGEGITDEGNQYTVEFSSYKGTTHISQEDERIYHIHIDNLIQERKIGELWEEDDQIYCGVEPYGVVGSEGFTYYLEGTSLEYIPEDLIGASPTDITKSIKDYDVLPCDVLIDYQNRIVFWEFNQ